MPENSDELSRATAAVIARATNDDAFRASLIGDPISTLRAEGIDLPEGVAVTVLQSTPKHGYLVLPDPATVEDQVLAAASGGSTASSAGSIGCMGCVPLTWSTASTAGSAGSAG